MNQHRDNIDPHEYLASDELPGHEHAHHVHVTPFWTMFWVFMILLFLTALTVWSSRLHYFSIGNTLIEFGATAHILMALAIAAIKSVLVAAYFMHLKYDKPIMTIVVGSTIFGVVLFLGLTLADLDTRSMTAKIEAQEIYKGGNLQLFAGETGPERAVKEKADMNVVTYASENAAAKDGNPDSHAEDGSHEDEPDSDGGEEDHAADEGGETH
ncbi:MAG: cytochrome C oxidase subunit IV family protein [Planctomycetota bacterium]